MFTVPTGPCLLSEDSLFGKIATHFCKHISLISHLNWICCFTKLKCQCASNYLTFSLLLPGIILYPISLFVSLFSCKIKKKKIRLWDIVLRIKEVFFCLFNKRNINHNIPFYIELETHKNSKFGKRCLAGKAWDAHLIPSSN